MTHSPTVLVHARDLELDESVKMSIERRCEQLAEEFHEVARFEITVTEAGAGFNVQGHATGKHTDVATHADARIFGPERLSARPVPLGLWSRT